MNEIFIKLIDYKDTKIIEGLDDCIILGEKHLEYKWKCSVAIIEDGDSQRADYRGSRSIIKESIAGVQAYWSASHERFICSLLSDDSPIFMFETYKEANKLKETIFNWLLSE